MSASIVTEVQYRRLARLLEQRIRAGDYTVGARIPSERELGQLFGVSRITVRQALAELVRRGLLIRRQGYGTIVAAPRIESPLLGHFSFSEALRAQGLLTSTQVLDQRVDPAIAEDAEDLEIPAGAPVLRLVRLRNVDGEPFALETTLLPLDRLPGVDKANFAARSLYAVLKADLGVYPARARETFEPMVLRLEEARLLGAKKGAPALLLSRTTYDVESRPIEAARALIRGDRCRLLVELWATRLAQTGSAAVGGARADLHS